ncbi:MAG: VWA domain-containing protein [Prochloraceae cyanobacterium]
MKICHSCGASNTDAAKFCVECGVALKSIGKQEQKKIEFKEDRSESIVPATVIPPTEIPPKSPNKKILEDTVVINQQSTIETVGRRLQKLQAKRQADIMFVLDCTESMAGEIGAIKDTIVDFAKSIESQGVRARVGLVEFRDRLCNEEQRVLTFNGEVFTSDPTAFRREVAKLKAIGGGDWPESSLDGLMLALRQPFNPTGSKVIVLVTDAPPHIPDRETNSIDQVIEAIRQRQIDGIYLVMRTQDPESQVYLKLLEATRGLAFELGTGDDFRKRSQDFKGTLMALGKTISQATR